MIVMCYLYRTPPCCAIILNMGITSKLFLGLFSVYRKPSNSTVMQGRTMTMFGWCQLSFPSYGKPGNLNIDVIVHVNYSLDSFGVCGRYKFWSQSPKYLFSASKQ